MDLVHQMGVYPNQCWPNSLTHIYDTRGRWVKRSKDKTTNLPCTRQILLILLALQWRHNEGDGISNHRRFHCLLNCWFRRRSKKTSKPRVTGLCEGNSSVTGEFPAQKGSNAENTSNWWHHHEITRRLHDLMSLKRSIYVYHFCTNTAYMNKYLVYSVLELQHYIHHPDWGNRHLALLRVIG